MTFSEYTGRFAPSPTGPLHAGSLVAALASWLDARAHGGRWLVRMEDVDLPRSQAGAADTILLQLESLGLRPDAAPLYQSQRSHHYEEALRQLRGQHRAYRCTCTRKDIADALLAQGATRARHQELVYPGTCRPVPPKPLTLPTPTGVERARPAASWRFNTTYHNFFGAYAYTEPQHIATNFKHILPNFISKMPIFKWHDRRLGDQQQAVDAEVGDFVLQRADGCFTYQLAVVVDDAAQGITDIVRGQDLADNTARQILLQQALGLPTPRYLHTPLVLAADGQKLSKQNGAAALDAAKPLQALSEAAGVLGLVHGADPSASIGDALLHWVQQWRGLYNLRPSATVQSLT